MTTPLPQRAKILFFTDLDSTVIFSHRHAHDASCIWVEELNGRQQSFMTQKSYSYLQKQNWLKTVPLTTRTSQQYARLHALAGTMGWQDALLCNGAIRLQGEQEDLQWRAESERLSAPDLQELLRLKQLAADRAGAESIIYAEPFLFYVKAGEDVSGMTALLCSQADARRFIIFHDARKVYCIPQQFSKGNAAKRYARLYGAQSFLAAGDGTLDVSMLNAAKACFCPPEISSLVQPEGTLFCCAQPFPDTFCDLLEQIHVKEIRI